MKSARLEIVDVTYPDRISHLPQDLLFKILSLVPISDAMKTSLLSKRWKSVWKMMPTLVYDEYSCLNIGTLGFDEFCGRSLKLHEAPDLKTLTLILKEQSKSLDTLLFPNIRSNLHEIRIISTCNPCRKSPISFPSNLKIYQTLVVLKLQGTILLDAVDSPVCFPNLKTMHLLLVQYSSEGYSSEESFCRLLSACPVLEHLYLKRLCGVGRFRFTISVPSLLGLYFTSEPAAYYNDDPSLEINAPSLKYLKIKDYSLSFNIVQDMPKLVDAEVFVRESKTEEFLRFVTPVEFLTINLYVSAVPLLANRISNGLLYLELSIYNKILALTLLLHLLKHSPNLKILNLNERNFGHTRETKNPPCSIYDPSLVPECLSFHLKTLQWRGYEGTEEEKEMVGYILQNAPCLKTAKISIYSRGPRGGENDLIRIKELESMSKVSTSCQLVIQLDNYC